jgi:hypothetical protein
MLPRVRPVTLVVSVLAVTSVVGCRGKALGTAELHGAGTADAHFTSTGGKLALWADTDGKWRGTKHMPVYYDVDFLVGGKSVGKVLCDTSDVSQSVCGMQVTIGAEHSGDCEMKLPCQVPTLPSGAVIMRVNAKPGPQVEKATKLSLNVRQD